MILRITYDTIFVAVMCFLIGFWFCYLCMKRNIKVLEAQLKDCRERLAKTTANFQEYVHKRNEREGLI